MRELLRRLDSRELTEWQCYFSLEPWGEERADLRTGVVASLVANIVRKEGHAPFTPQDFMLYPEEREQPKQKNSPETEAAYLKLVMELSAARQRKYGTA